MTIEDLYQSPDAPKPELKDLVRPDDKNVKVRVGAVEAVVFKKDCHAVVAPVSYRRKVARMIIEWNATTISKIIIEHYEKLSPSDQLTLQQICTLGLRKTLPGWTRNTVLKAN